MPAAAAAFGDCLATALIGSNAASSAICKKPAASQVQRSVGEGSTPCGSPRAGLTNSRAGCRGCQDLSTASGSGLCSKTENAVIRWIFPPPVNWPASIMSPTSKRQCERPAAAPASRAEAIAAGHESMPINRRRLRMFSGGSTALRRSPLAHPASTQTISSSGNCSPSCRSVSSTVCTIWENCRPGTDSPFG
jgi:hypothetical protein